VLLKVLSHSQSLGLDSSENLVGDHILSGSMIDSLQIIILDKRCILEDFTHFVFLDVFGQEVLRWDQDRKFEETSFMSTHIFHRHVLFTILSEFRPVSRHFLVVRESSLAIHN
jgi:hypothetical protein